VDARDISDVDVMLDIVKSVGLSVDAAREVLDKRTFKDAVDEGLGALPPVRNHGRADVRGRQPGVVGAQPYDVLEQLVKAP
jgi:predicted DsbA family dithiol-disulfide isomerase